MNKNRELGIDIARLLFMLMVVVLHTLAGLGNLDDLDLNSSQGSLMWFAEILCFCAVDGFGIISGYVSYGRKHNVSKLINIWFQVVFYTFLLEIIISLIKNTFNYSLFGIIKLCLPIIMNKYWYFSCYAALFLLMPVIDSFIEKYTNEFILKFLITIIFVFTIINLPYDPFNLNDGYSLIWLVILYMIGATLKKTKSIFKIRSYLLVYGIIINTFLAWFLHVKINYNLFTNYTSPLILMNAFLIVVCLSRITKTNKFISTLAVCAFGVYLNHWKIMSLIGPLFIHDIFEYNSFITLFMLILYAIIIFIICLFIDYVRQILFNIFNIGLISKRIEKLINLIINSLYQIIG